MTTVTDLARKHCHDRVHSWQGTIAKWLDGRGSWRFTQTSPFRDAEYCVWADLLTRDQAVRWNDVSP